MEKWQRALNKFMEPWEKEDDVTGDLVCGSYTAASQTAILMRMSISP